MPSLHDRLTDLVLVCCHAVYVGDGRDTAEDQWLLQSFQRSDAVLGKPSEHETMMAHIVAGATAAENRPRSMLVFSGGRTSSAEHSESEGYLRVFRNLEQGLDDARRRTVLEEHATDSYQNLLFSILRFHSVLGRYPSSITVVTHAFKERRFLELHARAIKWPPGRIRVQGINPPFTLDELRQTQMGEETRGYQPFVADPYGVHSPLADKRLARNWDPTDLHKIALEVEDVVGELLQWEGGESGNEIFPKRLPWED